MSSLHSDDQHHRLPIVRLSFGKSRIRTVASLVTCLEYQLPLLFRLLIAALLSAHTYQDIVLTLLFEVRPPADLLH